jgi:GNAT superfamily N-acetyltransferase
VTEAPAYKVASVEPAHASALASLFASNGYGCYCRFWHFSGTAREWLARCAQKPDENEHEMRAELRAGSAEMRGMVAWAAPEPNVVTEPDGATPLELIGWLKLAPAASVMKLYDQRLYKRLPALAGDRSATYTVACLLVREDFRRRGVARALLAAAIEAARGWGARRLEAFPRSDVDVPGSALMTGPSRLFLDAGFQVVHDFQPYPVLRLELTRDAP